VTLSERADPQAFEHQLAALKKKYLNEADNQRISYLLQPLSDVHTETRYAEAGSGYHVSRQMLWGLVSLAVFLLLIASFNFINLTTAQALRRQKEVGVRKVVGSTQAQLFGQFLGETLLIATVAGLISLSVLHVLLDWLNRSLTIINLDLRLDASVWLFGAGLSGVVALFAGCYPAIVLSRSKPIVALKNTAIHPVGDVSLRQGLIVLQFCITYGLLIATLVASRQMALFQQQELGFSKDAVITVTGPRNQTSGKMDAFRQRLLQDPAIRAVSLSSGAPITDNHYGTDFRLKSESAEMNRQAEMKVVDLAYQSLFGLQTVAGTWFSPGNIVPNGSPFNGLVVNETLVKMLGLTPDTAIGTTVAINEGEAPIIGVVKDFHNASLQQAITPCVLLCWNTDFFEQIHIALQTSGSQWSNVGQTLRSIEQNWQQLFPQDVYQYAFLNESLAKGYIVEQLVFDAFRVFAAISIFISCLGLFGLIAFMAEQRRKEIGIRKVLGASVAGITGLLAKDFLKLVLIAIVIASPIAYYFMNNWLADFAYRIDIQWWMFVAAGVVALAIAFLTVGGQAVKAALANPVKSLRSE
jgi:putative ABC transport system permease protein